MSSVFIPKPRQIESDFGQLGEAPKARRKVSKRRGGRQSLSNAELVRRSGITNIVFRYSTGSFHALGANGEEIASGKTVNDIISAL